MRAKTKIIVVVACVGVALLVVAIYGLFHGYFDHGQFVIKRVQWSSSRQVAMLAERSDNEALGGLEYYVLIGNHLFTPAELRHAYYSNAVILHSPCDCLTLHWEGADRLTISYDGSNELLKGFITVQRQQIDNTAILFENIPKSSPK